MYLHTYVYAYTPQNEDLNDDFLAHVTQERQLLCQKSIFISTTSFEQKKKSYEQKRFLLFIR